MNETTMGHKIRTRTTAPEQFALIKSLKDETIQELVNIEYKYNSTKEWTLSFLHLCLLTLLFIQNQGIVMNMCRNNHAYDLSDCKKGNTCKPNCMSLNVICGIFSLSPCKVCLLNEPFRVHTRILYSLVNPCPAE